MAIKYFLPAIAWGIVILAALSMPPSNLPEGVLSKLLHLDKVIHFVFFCVLGVLCSFGFFKQKQGGFFQPRFVFLTIIIGLFYGIFTELLQHFFLTGRQGSISDVIADLFGTVFGVVLFRVVLIFKPKIL